MVEVTRRIVRWEDALQPTIGWDVPPYEYEWESSVELAAPLAAAIGRDMPVDLLGRARQAVSRAQEHIRCVLRPASPADVAVAWDELVRVLDRVARGVLVREGPDGSRQRAEARLASFPRLVVESRSLVRVAVVVTWERLGPWLSDEERSQTVSLTGTSTSVLLQQAGTTPTRAVRLRLQSTAAGGIIAPTVRELVRGTEVTVSTTLGNGHILELDMAEERARLSTDGGVTWTDTTNQVSIPTTQVGWLAIEPGTSEFLVQCSSTMSGTLAVFWRDAWLM